MIADPAAVFEGCTENANLFGAPAVTLKPLLVALISEPSVANRVKPVPALLGTRLEKVATPLEAATVVVEPPLKTPGLLIAIETFELSEVTRFPNWSTTLTVTAGVIALPA